jgi:hypothetical protein
MSQLVIDNPPAGLLVRLGDALVADGSIEAAAPLYRQAMEICQPESRSAVLSRIGFTTLDAATARRQLILLQEVERQAGGGNVFVGVGMALSFRNHSFLDDERFMAIAEKHRGLLPMANWHWNLNAALWAVWQAKDVAGDFVEFGVFKGHTTLFLADYLDFATWPRRWFLYDTFDGIPDDQLNAGWAERNEKVYKGTYSFAEVRDRFSAFPNIEVIQGRVPEVLDQRCPDRIAFVPEPIQ